jgi:hypothetical protein
MCVQSFPGDEPWNQRPVRVVDLETGQLVNVQAGSPLWEILAQRHRDNSNLVTIAVTDFWEVEEKRALLEALSRNAQRRFLFQINNAAMQSELERALQSQLMGLIAAGAVWHDSIRWCWRANTDEVEKILGGD